MFYAVNRMKADLFKVMFLINDVHGFKVALRIRPLNDAEIEEGATTVAHKIDSQVRKKTTNQKSQMTTEIHF